MRTNKKTKNQKMYHLRNKRIIKIQKRKKNLQRKNITKKI